MDSPPQITPPPTTSSPPITSSPASPRGSDKLWSIISHLSPLIGIGYFVVPLIIYLAMKNDSQYVANNAKEALNFHISLFIYWICCIPLIFVLGLGVLLMIALGVALLILAIIAAVKAADGGCFHYPLTLRLIQ
jgi:uncharacterized Tic20 family protein